LKVDFLEPPDRLILSADLKPDEGGVNGLRRRILALAESVADTGVTFKINSALRVCGYSLIKDLHDRGMKVMADLKLNDIPETMGTDASMLVEYRPEFLTLMCSAGIDGLKKVRDTLRTTQLLGVSILTSLDEEECQAIFSCSIKAGVLHFARMAQLADLDGLVSSGAELAVLKRHQELTLSLNTPAIRPQWAMIRWDDQEKARVMTPKQAIQDGADRIIIGRPILEAKTNNHGFPQTPREAIEKTLDEIREAVASCDC